VSSQPIELFGLPVSARHASVALLGFVLLIDLFWSLVSSSTGPAEFGVVDEPAHLATGLLFLIAFLVALRSPPSLTFAVSALVASVAIDLDHVPGWLGWHGLFGEGVPRPYPHGMITPLGLLVLGAVVGGRARQIAFGAAFGVCAHLARDVATGPGIAPFWPLSTATVKVPYVAFAAALLLAAAIVYLRGATRPAPPLPSPDPA
jgi:hypothetical protein